MDEEMMMALMDAYTMEFVEADGPVMEITFDVIIHGTPMRVYFRYLRKEPLEVDPSVHGDVDKYLESMSGPY